MEINKTNSNARRILVVDDNEVILRSLLLTLKPRGYEVITAVGGPESLSAMRKAKPDLILLDLTFPLDTANIGGPMQDGFFIINWIRRAPEFEKIPIIIISGTEPEKYRDRARAAGVVACFHKPIDKEKLLEAIQATLGETAAAAGVKT